MAVELSEADGRAALVAEALTWLGTPYHHRGRVKGAGVDCAQLVAGVYAGAGVLDLPPYDMYPQQWHLHQEAERLLRVILKYGDEIEWDDLKGGDVILYKYGKTYSHAVIVTEFPRGVHAHLRDGAVVVAELDRNSELISLPRRCFSHWPRRR